MFSKGDTLYEVGDDPVYVYFILRGRCVEIVASYNIAMAAQYHAMPSYSVEFSTDRTVSGSKTVKFSDEGFHIGDTGKVIHGCITFYA